MKIIVTGGCGFIGSHIAEILCKEGHDVIILDNLSNGRIENISNLIENFNCKFYEVDIQNLDLIFPFFEKVDFVFHMAALADIVPSINNPGKYHDSNVNGTIAVLEASRMSQVKRFVYAGSSSCYGVPETYPTNEDSKISPQYPYALTKYIGEQYVNHWNKVYGLKTTILRFFNVYGTRSRTSGTYGAVFGVFLAQKINNKPFTVVGDGNQTRDFTYVTDVANACITAALSEKAVGETFNVGSGNTYSINKLVALLKGDVEFIPKRPGEPDCTFADITKIKNVLGWEPAVSFEQGVDNLLMNLDYWKNAPVWDKQSIEIATLDWFKFLK
jgi:UDP-glucose 4-epimerase